MSNSTVGSNGHCCAGVAEKYTYIGHLLKPGELPADNTDTEDEVGENKKVN